MPDTEHRTPNIGHRTSDTEPGSTTEQAAPAGRQDNAAPDIVFAFPAHIIGARDVSAMMKKARASAGDPAVFEDANPFFWTSEISSSRMDAYYTHMLPSSLRNFKEDLQAGVSFQNSHRTGELGFGRSFDGRYVGGGGNGVSRVEGDFYTVPGLNLNGVSTDDLIRGIQTGLVADNSVGFYLGAEGRYLCDLCQRDVMECGHYPGFRYEVTGKKELQLATAGVDNARLSETSAVYDGATPHAGIIKAQRAADSGLLAPEMARALEECYRIKLPAARHAWAGIDTDTKEAAMPNKQTAPGGDGTFTEEQIRSTLAEANWTLGSDLTVSLRELAEAAHASAAHEKRANDAEKERDAQKAEAERLAPLADMGRVYKADLIEETITECVRAFGNAYPVETERKLLEAADLEQIKAKRDFNKGLAAQANQGGRVTTDPERDPDSSTRRDGVPAIPNAAYQA